MLKPFTKVTVLVFSFYLLTSQMLMAYELRIAVASNFSETLKALATKYEKQTDNKIIIISGSTGKLYAQIKNGAPFDAFFSADTTRAKRLDSEGIAIPGSRFTYAVGKVILWSPQNDYVDSEGNILKKQHFRYLSIANPKLAPYGQAAYEILQALGLWNKLKGQIVRGESIGQAFQFVKSGNAELGFVALSQIKHNKAYIDGSYWEVPQSFYQPIKQQAVQLKENPETREFLAYIKSDESLKLIHNFGYSDNYAQ